MRRTLRSVSREARVLAGIGVALWLLGVFTGVGATLLAVHFTQEHKNREFTYSINRGACAAYSLVDPTIRANNTLITTLKAAIKSPQTSAAMLKLDRARLKAVEKQTTAFQSFRAIYGTIPASFDCHRLPKQPPT